MSVPPRFSSTRLCTFMIVRICSGRRNKRGEIKSRRHCLKWYKHKIPCQPKVWRGEGRGEGERGEGKCLVVDDANLTIMLQATNYNRTCQLTTANQIML